MNPDPAEEKDAPEPSGQGETRLEPAGEAVVIYKEEPLKPPADKRIHSRRPLPLVPEGPSEEPEQNS